MSADKRSPPPYRYATVYSEKLTIALFGKRAQLKNSIGKMILGNNSAVVTMSNDFVVETNNTFRVINTPDFFDEDYPHPDQRVIDFMAHSHPGPDLFILAIDAGNTKEENVVAQICKLQEMFGENLTAHLVVTLPDIESFQSLSDLKQRFNSRLATAHENLASECRKWCLGHQFSYDYKHYSEEVVKRRMTDLKMRRYDGNPQHHHWRASSDHTSPSVSQHASDVPARPASPEHHADNTAEKFDNIFNVVLLGLTGTGKSATGNTIMAAGKSWLDSKPSLKFKSEPSSVPVTTNCEVRTVAKLFGREVRVVDTPDFFHNQLRNAQAQVEECKKYCQPGRCVVLLVIQLGRVTDGERDILEKLENKLGWKIRESTIILLTHGEELKGDPDKAINAEIHLKRIVEMCGRRYHLFNNKSESNKQVTDLIKKIPNYENVFPKFTKTTCCIC